MARGSKKSYTSKQHRKAHRIEEIMQKRAMSSERAAPTGEATVSKPNGGGTKSGRGTTRRTASSRKGGRKGGKR